MTEADSLVSVTQKRQGEVLVLTLTEPGNSVDAACLAGLKDTLSQAATDPGVRGVVLALRGGHSVVPALSPALVDLGNRLDRLGKPVIAVLQGSVGGALWALALACHARFAEAGAQVVMPEARLGFLPGGGITQRLPRLVGAAEAIGLMLSTRPEPVQAMLTLGALDRVCSGTALSEAVAAIDGGWAARPSRHEDRAMRDGRSYLAQVQAFQARVSGDPLDVSRAVVKSVEAALLLPFAQGLAFEAVTLDDLAAAPETRAVAHANQVDRIVRERLRALAARVKGAGSTGVARLGLWRSGPERAELVVAALTRGLSVVLADPDGDVRMALVNRTLGLQEAMVAQKTLTPEARDADRARLSVQSDPRGLDDCDLILLANPVFPTGGADLPLIALGHVTNDPNPLPALLPAAGPGGHAEISLPQRLAPRAVGQVLDLAQKRGWRVQHVGPGGFVARRLRRVLRDLPGRLTDLGYDGKAVTKGMAAMGLGAQAPGRRRDPEGADHEVGHLAMAALADEAARILDEGLGLSSAEVDAAAMAAGVMPRWQGGPLYQADLRGLILLRADLQRLAAKDGGAVAPLIERLIRDGRRFYNPD